MKHVSEHVRIPEKDGIGEFYVPRRHRESILLSDNSIVNGVYLATSNLEEEASIVLSEYPIDSWADLWKITVIFNDDSGQFMELMEIMSDDSLQINVLANQIAPVRGKGGHASIVADLTKYGDCEIPDGCSNTRINHPDASIQFLLDHITVQLLEKIRISQGVPQVFANRLHELHAIGSTLNSEEACRFSAWINEGVLQFHPNSHTNSTIVWDLFKKGLEDEMGSYSVFVTSDTEERYVRITAKPEKNIYFPRSVKLEDKPGELMKFLDKVCPPKEENHKLSIKASHLDLKIANEEAYWYSLLEYKGAQDKSYSETEWRNITTDISERLSSFGADGDVRFSLPVSAEIERLDETKKVLIQVLTRKFTLNDEQKEELSQTVNQIGLVKIQLETGNVIEQIRAEEGLEVIYQLLEELPSFHDINSVTLRINQLSQSFNLSNHSALSDGNDSA